MTYSAVVTEVLYLVSFLSKKKKVLYLVSYYVT